MSTTLPFVFIKSAKALQAGLSLHCSIFFQVYNKIDQVSIEEVDRLARTPNSVVVR